MDAAQAPESFRGLLLGHRARTGLTQRDLARQAGVSRGAVQDWESGLNYPTAERLQALIRVLLDAGGLTAGREAAEARELWTAAEREASRMHPPFDGQWFAGLLAAHASPTSMPVTDIPPERPADESRSGAVKRAQDWGEAPDTMGLVGRTDELALLRRWVLDEGCRLVAVLGMGGIGKTSLTAKLAQEVAPGFERIYWRSLRDAPPVSDWLAGAIGFLSDQQRVPPAAESERLARLLQLLRERRCLLVLDNSETLFEPGQRQGRYRTGMAGYGRLLLDVGDTSHRSCLVLTSREAPPELPALADDAVRTLQLGGLGVDEAQVLLAPKQLDGTAQQWAELNARFGGNGLALKVIGESIRELFAGEIGSFLDEAGAGRVFGGIRRLLADQVDRSSALEQQVLRGLAVKREPVQMAAILAALGPLAGRGAVLEAIEALRRRSLVERAEAVGPAAFTLQSVVLEYVTDRLVEHVVDEIGGGQPEELVEQPLIKAQAYEYARQAQERLIGAPILQQLNVRHGASGTEARLLALLENWRDRPLAVQAYGPGNVVNLLRLLRGDLRQQNLSRLELREAYLAEVDAQDASLAGAHVAESVLAEAFYFPSSIALSADGALLAVGTSTGEVWMLRVADRMPLLAVQAHAGLVLGVALSSDGRLLASGGGDGVVRLWETPTGRPLTKLQSHTGGVRGVALSSDGRLLATGGGDGVVRVWETTTGQQLATLQGHNGVVWGVALSSDGELLASGSADRTVRLWQTTTGRQLATLQGHAGTVWAVELSADGRLLASGGGDGVVRLWDTATGQPRATLQGHTGEVLCVALHASGELLASGDADGMVRLWETRSGQPRVTQQGHRGGVFDVALSADGRLLASGGGDGTVRLWKTSSGQLLGTLQGHTGVVRGVALAADGQLVASGGYDGTVRLWEASTGTCLRTLRPERRYERMDITGLTGVTSAQRAALLALGAIDQSS